MSQAPRCAARHVKSNGRSRSPSLNPYAIHQLAPKLPLRPDAKGALDPDSAGLPRCRWCQDAGPQRVSPYAETLREGAREGPRRPRQGQYTQRHEPSRQIANSAPMHTAAQYANAADAPSMSPQLEPIAST
jgi:hypothetical protein